MNNDYVAEILRATAPCGPATRRRERHHSERARSSGSDGLRWRGLRKPEPRHPASRSRQARLTEPNFRRGPIGCGNP